MAGGVVERNSLQPETWESIATQQPRGRSQILYSCGCGEMGAGKVKATKFYLCSYHQGYEHAIERIRG